MKLFFLRPYFKTCLKLSVSLLAISSLSGLAATWGSDKQQDEPNQSSSSHWSTTDLTPTAEIERITDKTNYNNFLNEHWRLFPRASYYGPSYHQPYQSLPNNGPAYRDGEFRPGFRVPYLLEPTENCVKRREAGVEIEAGDCAEAPKEAPLL